MDNGPCATGITTDQVVVQVFDENTPSANAGADQNLCTSDGTSAQLNASPVTFPAIGTWTLVQGQGTFTDANDPNTTITNLGVGVNVCEWTVDNGACPNGLTSDQLIITLYDENNPDADAGPDQELCTPTGTATSTNMQGSAIIFPAVGTWSVVSSTGNILNPNDPVTAVLGLEVGEHIFEWSVFNGPCDPSNTTDIVVIRVYDENNLDAEAGPDQQVCTPLTSATMAGSAIIFPAVGTWTLISGQGSIAQANDPFTAITNLGLGANVFQWTIDNGPCGSSNDQVTLMVYDHTVPPADAGPDQDFCQTTTSTTLNATPATSTATGSWSRIAGSGTIAQPTDPATTVTGLALGSNVFVWTVSNGECGTTTDTMTVLVKDCETIVIPDAFSPNGDGTNDVFVITNIEYYPSNKFLVFNRWGNKVYEATPYNNQWDCLLYTSDAADE